MQPEHAGSSIDVYNEALAYPAAERGAFLQRRCAGNETLRHDVELLLSYHDKAGDFIQSPAFEVAPEFLADDPDALIGQHLGHYRVDAVLGIGGMGVVYLACDERLGRKVGLKLLPPSLVADEAQLEQLKREARTASALNHPNIVTIHEVGEADGIHYIATEYIEGVTLRERIAGDPIPPNEAVEIAQQVASALAVAHEAGIVHRDIKPENIMLRRDGYVKVLDFGIAKFVRPESLAGLQTSTRPLILGTARYMSPEQTRGLSVDARTDIWSLGVVLYEMLVGQPPFSGDTNTDVIASVLRTDPPSLDRSVPTSLQRIVSRALAKDLAARFQTAAELRHQLQQIARHSDPFVRHPRWIMAAVAGAILALIGAWWWWQPNQSVFTGRPSIAVLPLQNLSSDPNDRYFALGIQDELLTRLSKIAALKVISRTSTQKYQSAPENLREIGKQLDVTNLVEGSVQRIGNSVKINVQLIRADRDEHLWAESYSRPLNDIFGIEGEVASAIAQQLHVKLTGAEEKALINRPTSNAAAYEAYLRGVAVESTHVSSSPMLEQAVASYDEAVRLDPKFALAWSHLAIAHSLLYALGKDTAAHSAGVKIAAEQAMALEPHLAESWIAQGIYRYRIVRDFPGALQAYEEALKRWPNSALALEQVAYLERRMGRWETGLAHHRQAVSLDPNNIKLAEALKGTFLVSLRRWDEIDALNARISAFGVDDETTFANRALEFQIRGQLDEAAKLLAQIEGEPNDLIARTKMQQLVLERRFDEAIAKMQKLIAHTLKPGEPLNEETQVRLAQLGYYQEWAGRTAEARDSFTRAVEAMKPSPDTVIPVTPKKMPCHLALAYAGLGEKDSALNQAQRAVEDYRDDAVDRPYAEWTLAQIQARFGDVDAAIAALPHLLEVPNGLTQGRLRYEPLWDPLRSDPRFQKLIGEGASNDTPSSSNRSAQKSIAVLPFQNLSKDEENAFFADAVHDQILTDLAKVADLKVISRTSVMQYQQAATRNLREIARQLGVANVLEGTVQRAANRVRVNAQLINAQTDTHLWAETYDRDLADVFAIQSEIAEAIVHQLQVKLSPSEKSAIEAKPTSDITAFDLYSRGKTLLVQSVMSGRVRNNLLEAVELLNQAVARDPAMMLGYCQLEAAHTQLYFVHIDHTPQRLEAAEKAVQTALRLRPDAGEAHFAFAQFLYRCFLDYDRARAELAIAQRSLPHDSGVLALFASIARRQQRWDESIRNFNRAIELDPRNLFVFQQLALTYQMLRQYPDCTATLERALEVAPEDIDTRLQRAQVPLDASADAKPLQAAIENIRKADPATAFWLADGWFYLGLCERDAAAIDQSLVALQGDSFRLMNTGFARASRAFAKGWASRLRGDDAGARSAFLTARAEQEELLHAQSDYGLGVCMLGLIDALLGDKENALREGRRALELMPPSKDAITGSDVLTLSAAICALAGEKEIALEQLGSAAKLPGTLSYGQLKLLPYWDSLRGDPRFEKIVASLGPKDLATPIR